MVFGEQSLQEIELHRQHADGVRVENIPKIHDAGHPRKDSKINERHTVSLSISTAESSSCQCSTTLHGDTKAETCQSNAQEVADCYARRFSCGRWSFLGPGSEKKWYETCSDKPDGNWDRTAEMMMLQFNTESGHPNTSCIQCFWKRWFGKQRTWQEVYSLQRKCKKHRAASQHCDFCTSAQHLRSHSRSLQRIERRFSWRIIRRFRKPGNIWYGRRTKRDGNFMPRIYNALKGQDAHLAETQQSLRPIRPEQQQRKRQDQPLEGGENFDYYVDRKTGWLYYREPRENRGQRLHLQLRSGKLHSGKRVGAHGSLVANSDTSMHAEHTCTVAFSPSVLDTCSIFLSSDTDAHSVFGTRKRLHTVIIFHFFHKKTENWKLKTKKTKKLKTKN